MLETRVLLPAILTLAAVAVSSAGHAFPPPSYDLAFVSADAALYGIEGGAVVGDFFGVGLTTGDFNGDGVDDLLIGANNAAGPSNARPSAGEVYVVFGSSSLSGVRDLASAPPDVTIFGATGFDGIGKALAVGDVNDDAVDDIIIATPLGDGPGETRTNAGETYVIFGSPLLAGNIDLAAGAEDLTVYGAETEDRMGSVATGDVNGDGTDDILLGARSADGPSNGRLDGGEVYVIFGSPSLPFTKDFSVSPPDVTVYGAEGGDQLSGVGTGNVNGDGAADLLLGALFADGAGNNRSGAGEVYVLVGAESLAATIDMASAPQSATIIGADIADAIAPSGTGNLNGDGAADLVVVATLGDGPANNEDQAGEAHVVFGPLVGTRDLALSGLDFRVYGADAVDVLGSAFAIADVNADSVPDLILSAPAADTAGNARNSAGEVYAFYGSPSLGGSHDLGLSPADFTVFGARADDSLGVSLTTGDFNDDGILDLAMGAHLADGPGDGRNAAGDVYVFFGEDQCPGPAEDFDGFQDADGCPEPDNDLDGICDPGQTALSCVGTDSGSLCFDPAGTLICLTQDCRSLAEDYDAFKDSDGCPEPDNDNDGLPDVSDNCPGTGAQAGTNGMLGSPQDLNHNGIQDGAETLHSTDDSAVTVEDWDGIIDGDGCHDSPGDDYDGDSFGILDGGGLPMFRDEREVSFLGTNPTRPCALTPTADDEGPPDAWPFDFNDDQKAALSDVLRYIPVFNSFAPGPPYNARYDLNASGGITLGDVLLFIRVFNQDCAP